MVSTLVANVGMLPDSLRKITVFSVPLLPENAFSPTVSTPAGMTISEMPVLAKAKLPISSSCEPSANVTDFSCAMEASPVVEAPNAYAPSDFTVAGTLTLAILPLDSLAFEPEKSLARPPNALSPTAVTA